MESETKLSERIRIYSDRTWGSSSVEQVAMLEAFAKDAEALEGSKTEAAWHGPGEFPPDPIPEGHILIGYSNRKSKDEDYSLRQIACYPPKGPWTDWYGAIPNPDWWTVIAIPERDEARWNMPVRKTETEAEPDGPLKPGDLVKIFTGEAVFLRYESKPVTCLGCCVKDISGQEWYVTPPPNLSTSAERSASPVSAEGPYTVVDCSRPGDPHFGIAGPTFIARAWDNPINAESQCRAYNATFRAGQSSPSIGHERRVCELLVSAWYYGGFKAETPCEAEMQARLEAVGLWPTTEGAIVERSRIASSPSPWEDKDLKP